MFNNLIFSLNQNHFFISPVPFTYIVVRVKIEKKNQKIHSGYYRFQSRKYIFIVIK